MEMVEIQLVRHAEASRATADSGTPDPDLRSVGRNSAHLLAERMATSALEAVYCSPLRRARQTAQPIAAAHATEARVCDDLSELDLGHRDYVPPDLLGSALAEHLDRVREPVRGGNSNPLVTSFRALALATIDRIATDHQGAPAPVVVVSHLGFINAVLTGILGIWELVAFELGHTSVSRIYVGADGIRSVASVNENWIARTSDMSSARQ